MKKEILYKQKYLWNEILARRDCPEENIGEWVENMVLNKAAKDGISVLNAYSEINFDENIEPKYITVYCY